MTIIMIHNLMVVEITYTHGIISCDHSWQGVLDTTLRDKETEFSHGTLVFIKYIL